jgi:hypothetical protein
MKKRPPLCGAAAVFLLQMKKAAGSSGGFPSFDRIY